MKKIRRLRKNESSDSSNLKITFWIVCALMLVYWLYPSNPKVIDAAPEPTIVKDTAFVEPHEIKKQTVSDKQESLKTEHEERFVKLDAVGEPTNNQQKWSCVLDRQLNLIWEIKENDGGWQDKEFTYSWFQPLNYEQKPVDPLTLGREDAGTCLFIKCDTKSYITKLNQEKLCSKTQWRLPAEQELRSLDHPTAYFPDIDVRFFPNTMSGAYWSSTESPSDKQLALVVDFSNNIGYQVYKRLPQYVRGVTDAN